MEYQRQYYFVSRRLLIVWIALLFIGALAARLSNLNGNPSDFWTVRQYRGALLARAMYFENNPAVPEWRREVAAANKPALREPPILEWLASKGYRIMGSEQFRIPRIITVCSWLLGGWFLFLTARLWLSIEAALIAVMYYLYLPFGIAASRSFQPDPLMIMGLLAGLYTIVKYHDSPSTKRWLLCAAVSSLAILIKPGSSQFTLFGVYYFLALRRLGLRRALLDRWNGLFIVAAILPSACYILWSWRLGGDVQAHLESNFVPQWLLTWYFWRGWAGVLIKVLGMPALIFGFLGLRILRGSYRAAVHGWGLGYIAQCFLTSYTTPSHDYWHVQVIPLIGLGLGAISEPFWYFLRTRFPQAIRVVVFSLLLFSCFIGLRETTWFKPKKTYPNDYLQITEEIGRVVDHSVKTVFLDYDFGLSLCYFAEIAGRYWPETQVMDFRGLEGRATGIYDPAMSAVERFKEYYAGVKPEYFIICRTMRELDLQPGLKDFLFDNCRVVAFTRRYAVFDLKPIYSWMDGLSCIMVKK